MHTDMVTIFTDGSSRGNPGPGGFGAVVIAGNTVREIGGREERTTNNRMELMAAIKALQQIQDSRPNATGGQAGFKIQVFTDSNYLINGITKWVFGWQKNDWKTTLKKDVENRDLWEALVEAVRGKSVEWKYVGGHIGVSGNVRCDEIATAFADNLAPKLYSGDLSQYGIRNILDIKHDASAAKEKSASRAHSNAKAYSYVSLVDGAVQTHKTWAECEARVKGKPAKYKKVLSAEDERALISEWSTS